MSSASGPASMVKPPSIGSLKMTPPRRAPASSRMNGTLRLCSSYAQASPAIPPPTIATCVCIDFVRQSERAAHQLLQCGDEGRRRIQRLGASERRRELARGLRSLHVDVEQDLRMIADESYRHDDKLADANRRAIVDHLRKRWPDPRLGRTAGALVRD